MAKLFISYSREDRGLLSDFITTLCVYDTVWADPQISGGQKWWNKILEEIANCDIFIWLLSSSSITSLYCNAECTEALRLQKLILPLFIHNIKTEEIPVIIRDRHCIDMTQVTATSIANLNTAIKNLKQEIPDIGPDPIHNIPTPIPSDNVDGTRKERLIREMGSTNNTIACLAVEELRKAGWLYDGSLNKASLINANLEGANLEGVQLINADLSGANMCRADLHHAVFNDATLGNADLTEAVFNQTILANIDLSGTIGLDTIRSLGQNEITISTLFKSKGKIPEVFLRLCGTPENLITYLPSLVGMEIREGIEFYSCFISYSHSDKAFARRLHDTLQGEGIRCWLDEHELNPGDPIHSTIYEAIRIYDKVLFCCSRDSLTSWWADSEIDKAYQKEWALVTERGQKALVLIPLDLDGYLFSQEYTSGKAQQIRSRIAADFRGWEHDNNVFEREVGRLIKALRTDSGKEPPPQPKL